MQALLFRAVRDRGTALDKVAAALVRQAALACAPLPQHGWIHGDLNPGNLVLDGKLNITTLMFNVRFGGGKPQGVSPLVSGGAGLMRASVTSPGDVFDDVTRNAVDEIVWGTRGGSALRLNLMISYGGREELVRALEPVFDHYLRGDWVSG